MNQKGWKTAEKNVSTSFWVGVAPKSWSKYTTVIIHLIKPQVANQKKLKTKEKKERREREREREKKIENERERKQVQTWKPQKVERESWELLLSKVSTDPTEREEEPP